MRDQLGEDISQRNAGRIIDISGDAHFAIILGSCPSEPRHDRVSGRFVVSGKVECHRERVGGRSWTSYEMTMAR